MKKNKYKHIKNFEKQIEALKAQGADVSVYEDMLANYYLRVVLSSTGINR